MVRNGFRLLARRMYPVVPPHFGFRSSVLYLYLLSLFISSTGVCGFRNVGTPER